MPTQSLIEFEAEHSADGKRVQVQEGLWLYPTGAKLEKAWTPGSEPVRTPPPPNERARLHHIREYWRLRSEQGERFFHELQYHLDPAVMTTSFTPPEPPGCWDRLPPYKDEVEALEDIARRVREDRERLRAVEQQIEDLPEVQAERKRERAARESQERHRQRQQDLSRKIQSVSI
jgi:hypothetical protein